MNFFVIRLFLLICLTGALLDAPGQSCANTSSLDEIPDYLPYIVTAIGQYNAPVPRSGWGGIPISFLNMDDDPELEIIRSKPNYIICEDYTSEGYATHWQLNFPSEFHSPKDIHSGYTISESLDLGTGQTMVVANGSTANFMNNRFWVINAESGTIVNEFDLPGGPDLNNNGLWDGTYSIIGALDVPTETGTRKALIIVCQVGFDLEKRGVYAVDPWTGEIIWDFQPGSLLSPRQSRVVDIDGDGTQEVVLSSRAPCNLHGRKVNGFSDDIPYLFALGADGTLLWSRQLSPEPCTTYLQTGDLDGDGSLEIVLALGSIYEKKGLISVWNGHGELQAELPAEHHFFSCHLIPTDEENRLDIISGNRTSKIIRIRFDNNQLMIQQEATSSNGLNIINLLDLPESPGAKGIITQDRGGQGRILDWKFNLIASYTDNEKTQHRYAAVGNRNDASSFILLGSRQGSFTLEPNPLAVAGFFVRHFNNPRMLVLIGLSLGLIIAGLIWLANRRVAQEPSAVTIQPTNDPLHLKERRLHLLEDLEVSNHGAMAPLRSLRRLLWMLDAVQSGVGVNPNLVARMKEIWQDSHEDALPRLINILERARLANISDTVVDEALAAITRINASLTELNNDNFSADSVSLHLANLHKDEKSTEALLQSLRRQVSDLFRTSLSEVVEKVLRANHNAIEENSVIVQSGMLAAMEAGGGDQEVPEGSPHCRMDSDELGFILDNLVGNACLAMASSPQRNLNVFWQPINGVIKIEVSDSGIGIATEDHQRVMEPGFSTRPGGGLGLAQSQRLLRKYDGHLTIKRSQPGQGTTFLLVVPRA